MVHLFPFRTEKLSLIALMVLRFWPWESKSTPIFLKPRLFIQLGFFTFNAIRTKAKWNQPQFGFHYAYGIGEFQNKSEQNIAFKSMYNGFHEAGIFLNGLLTSVKSTIGIVFFIDLYIILIKIGKRISFRKLLLALHWIKSKSWGLGINFR